MDWRGGLCRCGSARFAVPRYFAHTETEAFRLRPPAPSPKLPLTPDLALNYHSMQTIKAEVVSGMANQEKSGAALDDGAAPLDENDQVLAAMEEEEATNTQPWWERSPWGGKEQAHWDLKEIAFYRSEWEVTQNPVFVWAALKKAMELPEPAPEQEMRFRDARAWIDDYLSECASRLLTAIDNPPTRGVGNEIAKALQFTFEPGQGSQLSRAQRLLRDRRLAWEVLHRIPAEGYKETQAVQYVAKANGISETVVGDAWRNFKSSWVC
jgi:hypothetical protein